jgi:hypothetical protein
MTLTQRRLSYALAFSGSLWAIPGCGGGSTSGFTAPAPAASGNISLRFSNRQNVKVPSTVFASNLKGKYVTQLNQDNIRLAFDDLANTGAFNLQFSKFYTLNLGDSFTFRGKGSSDFPPYGNSLVYAFDGETYRAQRGTVSITNSPSSDENPLTLRFILSKVVMKSTKDDASTFELNGTGDVRVPRVDS